ncbi:LPS assembly lipoprotein LptE [Pedobacter sp. PLR]|uniref:LPS assembly lipoprotein LptE n=1 Tax=Pedobacter sp. PLR TaxID=2994465 RepID=UPI0022463F7D|nr:LPS assembly lipoprotein LptE [Pedobacter sp. PLR]MCX2450489.1 LPS assembly lipoprotein LptE [Pedobacter sp. PLR]
MKKILLLLVVVAFSSCSIKFNGTSIPTEMKTANVLFFENNATLVVPTMATNITEALKNMIRNQTRLNITTNNPNAVFSGNITNYDIRPTTIIDANNSGVANTSPMNRMTIRVNVKYTNNLDPKASFEEPIERFIDFPTTGGNFTQQEPELNRKVIELITQDIFNRAFENW